MNKRFQKYALIIFGSLAAWCLAGKLQYIQNGYYSLVGSAEIVLAAPRLCWLRRYFICCSGRRSGLKMKRSDAKMKFTKEGLEKRAAKNGGSLDLRGTGITALPDNLTVGGWLYLQDTGITALPDNLTVGGSLYLRGTGITGKHCKRLRDGDCVNGRYLYADGTLTHVKRSKQVGEYTFYIGKIKGRNVLYDGTYYAHCDKFSDGVADITFKHASTRGADQYKGYTVDTEVTPEEVRVMYRIITGAFQQGTQSFIDSQSEIKDKYTIGEIIELTKGQYGASVFEKFFA